MRKRPASLAGLVGYLFEVFLEALMAACAEGLVSAIGWLLRKWRKRKKRKRSEADDER